MDKSAPAGLADFPIADLSGPKPERLADRVYENLFHAIVTGMITVGTRLPSENSLAREFDVSRPVLREALDRLRDEGLVSSVRGSGNYVQNPIGARREDGADATDRDALERIGDLLRGIELRLIIEPQAASLAARRRGPADIQRMRAALDRFDEAMRQDAILHHHDYAFHEAVAAATCNQRIVQTLQSLEYDVSRSVNLMRFLVQFQPLVSTEAVQAEHEDIFRHIEAGAATKAKRAMRNHIEHARVRMMSNRPGF
ncbi:FadR/GntR family transcriptional regulator [Pararhizobium haloflavum]|uniref:FadR/GntR family transcriptional regulator n=1 Tax=Pararhizobium haloflavum TaxID=2037914 RepID=UPI000C17AFD7|nr:FadR/GntR family transcriptional regulator [Pararhizobium haloflavum]